MPPEPAEVYPPPPRHYCILGGFRNGSDGQTSIGHVAEITKGSVPYSKRPRPVRLCRRQANQTTRAKTRDLSGIVVTSVRIPLNVPRTGSAGSITAPWQVAGAGLSGSSRN